MWSIDFNLRLLKAVHFVVDDIVVVGIVNVLVVALIVVTGHIIFSYVYKMLI